MNAARTMLVLIALLTITSPAHAYLDPGTGSMVVSAIVGLFATAALAIKTYWYKLKRFFRRSDSTTAPEDDLEPPSE